MEKGQGPPTAMPPMQGMLDIPAPPYPGPPVNNTGVYVQAQPVVHPGKTSESFPFTVM